VLFDHERSHQRRCRSGDGGERLVGGPGVIVQPCAETESRIFDGVEAAEDGPSDRGNDTVPERVCDERCTSGLDHDQPIVAYPWYVRSVA
jgi:hypothetical protein